MTKITKATFKKFIRQNEGKLFIKVHSKFDSMTDGIQSMISDFREIEKTEKHLEHNLGILDLWLVGGGHDYFSEFTDGQFKGIRVSNCCGSQTIAIWDGV